MALGDELLVYLRARFTLVVLVTQEEERAIEAVKEACRGLNRPCLSWDLGDGFQVLAGGRGGAAPAATDPVTALEQVERIEGDTVFVLKDFHDCWAGPMEKALAHGGGDAGTSTRVFGSILTWMQDKTAPCFVVGTANDQVPLSVSQAERIKTLQDWQHEGRAQSASFPEAPPDSSRFMPLEFK